MKAALTKALLVVSFCTSVHAERRAAAIPITLAASIDEWKGASYQVRLARDGRIEHSDILSRGRPIRIRVPINRWVSFRRHLDAAKIWSWHREYIDLAVADGKGWSLQITYADRRITSSGSNAYPPKKQFDEFLAAVRELTGGKPFE